MKRVLGPEASTSHAATGRHGRVVETSPQLLALDVATARREAASRRLRNEVAWIVGARTEVFGQRDAGYRLPRPAKRTLALNRSAGSRRPRPRSRSPLR